MIILIGPLSSGVTRSHLLAVSVVFKGTINYFSADICRIKNMICFGRYNTDVYWNHSNQTMLKKKVKVRSYIARYPVRRTAQSALHFTSWQTCSFQSHLNFSGKHSATLQLHEDYSFTFPPLSVLPGTHLYS